MIDEICGGVPNGKKVKAVIPGGSSSMPPLDADELDIPMEFDALMTDERIKPVQLKPGVNFELGPGKPLRTMAGSGGVIVMDEDTPTWSRCWRASSNFTRTSPAANARHAVKAPAWLARITKRLAKGA